MPNPKPPRDDATFKAASRHLLFGLLFVGCLLLILTVLFWRTTASHSPEARAKDEAASDSKPRSQTAKSLWRPPGATHANSNLNAQEIVAGKLSQFCRNRRAVLNAMAEHFKVPIPSDALKFFEAGEAGHWEEQTNLFALLKQQKTNSESLNILWGPIHESFGVAEQAHLWPASKLLEYGNAILDSLRPGMVYVGGTDPADAASSVVRQAWAKMASEQAALFLDRKLTGEAEQGFQIAAAIDPGNSEAVFRYVNLLMQQSRLDEATQIAQTGANAAPDNAQFRDLVNQLKTLNHK